MEHLNTLQGLGTAYERLRKTIDNLVSKLGGDKFARSVVTIGAREALHQEVQIGWRQGYASHMTFCEALIASPEQLLASTDRLERAFSLRDEPAVFRGTLGTGQLVVRGCAMYYETESAASMFAHYYQPYASKGQWTTSITSDAETYLAEHKMQRPSVSMTHSKSEDSALKSLVRIAKQHFGVKLVQQPVEAVVAEDLA